MTSYFVKNFISKKSSGTKTKQKRKKSKLHSNAFDTCSLENYNINLTFYNTYINQSCMLSWCKIWVNVYELSYLFT